MQIYNSKGEQLCFFLIIDSNNSMSPRVSLKTWKRAIKDLEEMAKEVDDDRWYVKVIKNEYYPDLCKATVKMLCNHKGWGGDFIRTIIVDTAYSFD